jgi:hypothetical protein
MAKVTLNETIVGELLIDPQGTNMGINWDPECNEETKAIAWNKFMKSYPTGSKIENRDINLS